MCRFQQRHNKHRASPFVCPPLLSPAQDVEFCFKLKERRPFHERHLAIVGVPEAVVQHPFWTDILRQISGWASGDVL